jgi:hypothetical protein
MSKYKIYACSFDLTNENYPMNKMEGVGRLENNTCIRTKIIDTKKEDLFADCKNEFDIEDRYEEFWNRLNGIKELERPYTTTNRREKVKVIRVVKL